MGGIRCRQWLGLMRGHGVSFTNSDNDGAGVRLLNSGSRLPAAASALMASPTSVTVCRCKEGAMPGSGTTYRCQSDKGTIRIGSVKVGAMACCSTARTWPPTSTVSACRPAPAALVQRLPSEAPAAGSACRRSMPTAWATSGSARRHRPGGTIGVSLVERVGGRHHQQQHNRYQGPRQTSGGTGAGRRVCRRLDIRPCRAPERLPSAAKHWPRRRQACCLSIRRVRRQSPEVSTPLAVSATSGNITMRAFNGLSTALAAT